MSTLTLPERELIAPPHLESGLLARTKPGKPVAVGAHVDSVIQLYDVFYRGTSQASVFVHPSTIVLMGNDITELDSAFTRPLLRIYQRWPDVSPPDLYQGLLKQIRPLTSFMDHQYTFSGAQVYEHSFDHQELDLLSQSIDALDVKNSQSEARGFLNTVENQNHKDSRSLNKTTPGREMDTETYRKDPHWWKKID